MNAHDPLRAFAHLTVSENETHTSQYVTSETTIGEGERNARLASMGGALRSRGATERSIFECLAIINVNQCVPPLPDDEVRSIAKSIGRYAPNLERYANSSEVRDGR